MRPPRMIVIAACFITATVLLFVSIRNSHVERTHIVGEVAAPEAGSMSFSFFHTPFSLFPPNAIISLTDDNTTSFLARPAAFGPGLPAKGLSGQLWIGSGFGDDSIRQGIVAAGAEGELGCSDVPGWVDGNTKSAGASVEGVSGSDGLTGSSSSKHARRSGVDRAVLESKTWRPDTFDPAADDGTDDHLHYPLPDSALAKTKPGKATHDTASQSNHADIQSLQEGAEIAGKVVLLSRGGCGFLEKVKWVQRRGGIALIVGDNLRGGPLIQMYARGDTSNVTIPAVFTSRTTAHLLSSLMGPNDLLEDAVDENGKPISKTQPAKSKNGGGKKVKPAQITPTQTLTAKAAVKTPVSKPESKSSQSKDTPESQSAGWFASLFAGSKGSAASDSRRPPSSGQLDWVLVEDWNEEQDTPKASPKDSSSSKDKGTQKVKSNAAPGDDFVIGVQDWRDPDLVGEPLKDGKAQTSTKNEGEKINSNGQSVASKQGNAAAKDTSKSTQDLKGGSITPGSGEYTHGSSANKDTAPPKGASDSNQKSGLLYKFFGDDDEEAQAAGLGGRPGKSMPPPKTASGTRQGGEEHEGVWVTLSQASGTSPFFDTLLVLVVSPLVTLTVVYGLLLVRSRIRRRRWRAPKSVVERLPVRTYHTVASSGSSSPRVPSPPGSSPSTPLLQSGRPRPRSQTISGPPEGSRSSGSGSGSGSGSSSTPGRPEHEKNTSISSEWKKFMGKQVECVVCLEEYVDGVSQVMSLPCGHEFHVDCITPWLTTRRRTCPICKGDVVRSLARGSPSSPRYESYHDDSDDDFQAQAAETVNDSPSAALPINSRTSEDIEQGIVSPRPSRPDLANRTASWRTLIASSFGSARSSSGNHRG